MDRHYINNSKLSLVADDINNMHSTNKLITLIIEILPTGSLTNLKQILN